MASNQNNLSITSRIRILKTGLFNVGRYLSIKTPEQIRYFEQLATPGNELQLVRDRTNPEEPFRINVLSPDGKLLGRVTPSKCETAARLMDAGIQVIAIVNDSLPVHDSDFQKVDLEDHEDNGWSGGERFGNEHSLCNLPFGIYAEGI